MTGKAGITEDLRLAAIAEALTLLALVFIAVPLKHAVGLPLVVTVLGPVHGLTFMVFLWFVVRTWSEGLIDYKAALRLFIGAMIPFGGFVNERWLRRHVTVEPI